MFQILSSTLGNDMNVTTLLKNCSLFVTENIIEKIVGRTNEFLKKALSYDKPCGCKQTDPVEMLAFFKLL